MIVSLTGASPAQHTALVDDLPFVDDVFAAGLTHRAMSGAADDLLDGRFQPHRLCREQVRIGHTLIAQQLRFPPVARLRCERSGCRACIVAWCDANGPSRL